MTTATAEITWPVATCCLDKEDQAEIGCPCGEQSAERALRGFKRGEFLQAMTREQREFCLRELEQIEGYSRDEHATDSDQDLAGTVLSAWVDYCRDKGLM